ncbi:MAG TPA: regulatory protein RecX [Geobacteraceae bacterium]|nr:regulatory protein RecX [Geobacteraceae bacterium]
MRSTEVDARKQALAVAMGMLARRDMSSTELLRRLARKGFSDELSEETVSRLRESGYLDDRRFARLWAESAIRNGRGFGPRLRLELARQRVPEEIATEVLDSLSAEYDEMETLASLLARKFSGFTPSSASDREKRRVLQYLQRRGFSTAAIFQAFRTGQTE